MLTSVPVTVLGNVYTSLSLVQGSTGDLAALGAKLGMVAQDPNGTKFSCLVQYNPSGTGGSLAAADGQCLRLIGDPKASSLNYVVDVTTAAGQTVFGVNDNSNSAVAVGNYFWVTISGPCAPLLATTIAAQTMVNASSTQGTLAAASSSAANQQTNIRSQASSGSGGKTDCYIYGGL